MRFPAVVRLSRPVASHSVGVSVRDVVEASESESLEGEDAREVTPSSAGLDSASVDITC